MAGSRQRVADFFVVVNDRCVAPPGLDSLFMFTPGFRTGARLFRAYGAGVVAGIHLTMGPSSRELREKEAQGLKPGSMCGF